MLKVRKKHGAFIKKSSISLRVIERYNTRVKHAFLCKYNNEQHDLRHGSIVISSSCLFTHLVLGRRTANFASAKKTFDSHSPEVVCNSPALAVVMTS